MKIQNIISRSAYLYTDAPAMSMKIGYRTLTVSYRQLEKKSQQVALFLQSKGIGKGDNVLLMAPNSPYWVFAFWGVILNGSVIVPLNVQMMPATITMIAGQTNPKLLFKGRRQEVDASIVGERCIVVDLEDLDELIAPFSAEYFEPVAISEEDLLQIMYTSGTTGDPKGVMHTHKNISVVIGELTHIIELEPMSDTLLSILPLSHIFEQVIGMMFPFYLGAHIIYAHSRSGLVPLMAKYRISKMIVVPEFLHLFMARLKYEFEERGLMWLFNGMRFVSRTINNKTFSRLIFYPVLKKLGGRLDTVASAGAALDPELEQEWEDVGIVVLQGYGMTEMSPLIATNTFEERKLGSVGKPVECTEVKINENGEILAKGENVFKGYYRNPELTRKSFDDQNWFMTGDMGEFDDEGFLFLKGRKKYMILKPGGQNVFPEDIEAALNVVEGVQDSCVYGHESDSGVIDIVAVVLLRPGAQDLDAIIARANEHLASYQQINDWHQWPETDFPRSAIRKVRKEEVKKCIAQLKEHTTVEQKAAEITPLHRILSQVTGVPASAITDQALMVKDLKLDSLTRVELISRIEEDLGKTIPETAITQKTTFGELKELLSKATMPAKRRTLNWWPRSTAARLVRPALQELAILPARLKLSIRVKGLEHLAQIKEPVIFMPNHVSLLDSLLVLWALPPQWRQQLSFAAGEDVLYETYKLFAPIVELTFNAFPLPRKENGNVQFGLSNIGQMLDDDYSVIIFPEGKMSESGELLPLKDGAGLIATLMRAPVVPVKLKGVRNLIGYNKLWPHAEGEIEVIFGKPMIFSMSTTMQEAKEQIHQALKSLD